MAMQTGLFVINDRFAVNPSSNEVTDQVLGKKERIEHRFMRVLERLADQRGEVVTREALIREVWNDYPGGDEGLTQAVSYLRKLLDDSQKEMIVTVPKAGYIFYGRVVAGDATPPATKAHLKRKKRTAVFLLLAASILALVLCRQYFIVKQKLKLQQDHETAKKMSEEDAKRQEKTQKEYGR